MATLMFFEETLKDQSDDASIDFEIGRSSFYDEDSIYFVIDGKTVIVTREQAKRFVDAVADVGGYLGLNK
ncbi:hypothetical protein GKR56_13535 [Providencia alcalifaciens]|jgi:hypothetical protein|uniref:hypothetical protein n=1 Tax=Providencia alcalifaciens TaxID=126385 RepID=UPI0012B600DD|nr:hypothetical protein [Providencia alcalifaciens]MTC54248.1 hypothetical protein [Providencia alcalifaciens]